MKLRSALRRLCSSCYMVRRQGRLFVYCKSNPRHKQRQGRGPRRKLHTLTAEGEGGEGLMSSSCGCPSHHHHHHLPQLPSPISSSASSSVIDNLLLCPPYVISKTTATTAIQPYTGRSGGDFFTKILSFVNMQSITNRLRPFFPPFSRSV